MTLIKIIGLEIYGAINIMGVRCSCETDFKKKKKVLISYYRFRVEVLSGRSLPRQREVKCELQSIPCKSQSISHSSSCSSKCVSIIHIKYISTYADEPCWEDKVTEIKRVLLSLPLTCEAINDNRCSLKLVRKDLKVWHGFQCRFDCGSWMLT